MKSRHTSSCISLTDLISLKREIEQTFPQLGLKKLKLFGGVQHFAEWGGRRGDLQLERSFTGFLDVLFVRETDDGSTTGLLYPNRPGDHRGLLELGFNWENENLSIHGFHQTPFESGLEIDIKNV
ncbi:MAG: hypothetical protein EOO93_02170, partial [Pedobacter sp.]